MTAASLQAILTELSRGYDYIVVDSPAHLEERILAVMEMAAHILVVTSFSITSVKDSKLTLKLLQSLGIEPERVSVVLNQTRAKISFPREEIEKSLRFLLLGPLPYEPRIDDSVDAGRPLLLTEPRCEFSRQLRLIADLVAPEDATELEGRAQRLGARRRFGVSR